MSLRLARIIRACVACGVVATVGVGCAMAPPAEDTLSERESALDVEEEASCGPSAPPDGATLWSRDLGPASLGRASVATDRAGNAFHARQEPELGVTQFGPGGNALWHMPVGAVVAADRSGYAYLGISATGGEPAKVTKVDPGGNPIWSRSIGNGVGTVQSIAVSASRAVVASGAAFGTVKLDPRGHIEWSKPFGGYVAIGAKGDVLISGSFHDTIDLGAGPVVSRGREDAFIVKLSSEGEYRWSHIIGDADLPIERPGGGSVTAPSDQLGKGIVEAPNGDVLVTGLAIDSMKLFGQDYATPVSSEAGVLPLGYIVRLDRRGTVVWSKLEFNVRDMRGLAVDDAGDVIVSGGFVCNVRPFACTWIQKLDPSGSVRWKHQESYGVGFGDATAVDRCGNIFFSVTAAEEPGREVHAFLFELRP